MSVTYTHAEHRDRRHAVVVARRLDASDVLLLSATLIGALTIALTSAGVARRVAATPDAITPADVRTVTTVEQLEPALEGMAGSAAERRFAARELLRALAARRASDESAPNVAAALAVDVSAPTIDGAPGLAAYRERLRRAREEAARDARAAPASVRLLTADDVAVVKRGFVVRTLDEFRGEVLVWGLACVLACPSVVLLWRLRAMHGDRLLLAAAALLTALGFAALVSRGDPVRDTLLFVRYTVGVLVGAGFLGALSLVDVRKPAFVRFSYVPLLAALFLSVLLIVFGDGPGRSGANVNLGPVQPIEAIRLLLALFLAGYFARRWELLRQTPRARYVIPVLAGVGAALMFFFAQKDLGPALFLTCVFLALHAVATGRVSVAAAGLAVLAAGFYIGYRLNISETLSGRIGMWQSPWQNAVRGGDQVAQAIWALATGGFFGTGPGLGATRYLPAGHTDLALAAVGEELGLVGLLLAAAAYGGIAWRGLRIAVDAATDYGFFLAAAVTLFLIVPVLVMGAGILGLIPLTGVVTPFLSYGGSAMTANFAALGILVAIGLGPRRSGALTPFHLPVRCMQAVVGAAAAAIVVVLVSVQVVNADDYAARPHFGVQADGVARSQYNPRVLDFIRELPRGTVYDRAGLALATGDPGVVARATQAYGRFGIVLDRTCGSPAERCYPLGGQAFHLLGDATTRANWSATNTSYVERDSQDRLRGFHDYAELIPAVRHRYDREHGAVRALLDRERDVHLAIDARLQRHVATTLATYAQRSSRTGRAAAVVLDADTGRVLAIASYPWPVATGSDRENHDALLDRARYGLYPPGSTFKLVTAAAALRRDPALSGRTFMCERLPQGRVGIQLRSGSVVRDDVLDRHPHGAIDMRRGVVQSCNAYFAQLATAVGPEALADAAGLLGISVAPVNSVSRIRATLPQAAYGQGDVLVTPLRMARLAAALASDGTVRDARLEAAPAKSSRGQSLVSRDAARLLARYMRDAVLEGTGRSLREHPWRIAGKTGTAEVAGAASHSWFVGFAPYGRATKRVAFAVVIENAGYGSLAAAPVAGEIVSAAASVGLVR
jgi:cell division protein FtsW (lipid II flippase)